VGVHTYHGEACPRPRLSSLPQTPRPQSQRPLISSPLAPDHRPHSPLSPAHQAAAIPATPDLLFNRPRSPFSMEGACWPGRESRIPRDHALDRRPGSPCKARPRHPNLLSSVVHGRRGGPPPPPPPPPGGGGPQGAPLWESGPNDILDSTAAAP
jgi:hypothetical protein